jgi:hypothetical protein
MTTIEFSISNRHCEYHVFAEQYPKLRPGSPVQQSSRTQYAESRDICYPSQQDITLELCASPRCGHIMLLGQGKYVANLKRLDYRFVTVILHKLQVATTTSRTWKRSYQSNFVLYHHSSSQSNSRYEPGACGAITFGSPLKPRRST